ncbi:hypothetical protein HKCCE2091_09675 [Rhodobacterales bacterium HKCCE2091]|nr:hypothetical protein [Rhodobacterales bacterium HKCCE2091]
MIDPVIAKMALLTLALGLGIGYPAGWYIGWRGISVIAGLGLAAIVALAAWGAVQGGWLRILAFHIAFFAGTPMLAGGLFGAAVARRSRVA